MIWLYRLLFLPMLLLLGPYYLGRMFKRGGYGRDFKHRLGLFPQLPAKKPPTPRLWIQAVSVGELLAVAPLVRMLHEKAGAEIILTTTTSTGYAILRERLSAHILAGGLFPIDFLPCSKLAWQRIQPDCVILMEGELWPEHLHRARRMGIPALLINARLSDRSHRRFQRLAAPTRKLLRHLDLILASSGLDAERFHSLAGPLPPVRRIGNLKFDVDIQPRLNPAEQCDLAHSFGFTGTPAPTMESTPAVKPLILLGASTWPGEEALLIRILQRALQEGVDCHLLLVPRHAERGGELQALLESTPLGWRRRSNAAAGGSGPVRIYLADTTGELAMLTQLADLVFIGKSLPPNEGGQSPVEAAALGVPCLFGPNMSNFREICRSLLEAAAARRCEDAAATEQACLSLLRSPDERAGMAVAARRWHQQNRGAAERIFEAVCRRLQENRGRHPTG